MAIPLAIPLIMSAIGAGTKVGAGILGGKQNAAFERSLGQERKGLEAWYDVQSNQDFFETDVAKSAMNAVLENIRQANQTAESKAAVTGASDAAVLAEKESNRKQFGDTAKNLLGYGLQRRDKIDQMYRAELGRMFGLERDLYTNKAQNAANLGSIGGDLLNAAAPLFGSPEWSDTTEVTGGTNPEGVGFTED